MSAQSVLLAFDTATEYCSVAIAVDNQLFSKTEKLGNAHSEYLLPWIDELAREANISLKNIDGIIFSAGPGSFTGLRIACGVAQGLGYGLDKKLLPASTLKTLAFHYRQQGRRIAVLNDARMSECYAAIYESDDQNEFKTICSEQLIKPNQVFDWLTLNRVDFVTGTAIGVYDMRLETFKTEYSHPKADYMIEWCRGCAQEANKLWIEPDKAAPLYIRNHVALTINERREGLKL